jgi:hypothetical protein
MSNEDIVSKCGLVLGSITATMTLADWDLILSVALKVVSIISFTLVIALNVDKLSEKLKKWIN